ncbi:MAG: DUF359 domain-containing protein [Acidilobaceae archaeon]
MYVSAFRLPEKLRKDYAVSLGPVTPSLEEILSNFETSGLICVGDVVSSTCIKSSSKRRIENIVVLYDRRTMRKPLALMNSSIEQLQLRIERVENPSSYVTTRAIETLCRLLEEACSTRNTRLALEVDGEEDLLALVALECGPRDWTVVYGMPGRGAVVVPLTPLLKSIIQNRVLQLKPELAPLRNSKT